MSLLNETHNPNLTSWVSSANEPGTEFPIQNLPFGVFKREGQEERIGVAIGDQILDLAECSDGGLLDGISSQLKTVCKQPTLNGLMALGRTQWTAIRSRLSDLLKTGSGNREESLKCLVPMAEAHMQLPASIGDYTDFYASIFHATNVGSMFRPDNPLLPNYKYVPIAYHGRASSIVVSGTSFKRPVGQLKDDNADRPGFGPSKLLDYELEVGFFVGTGNEMGEPIAIHKAEEHIFGLCLVNDWSARDIQRWEYQPLGPFLAKNFCTTVSPWVVTLEALEPFRSPLFNRSAGDPPPLPYLDAKPNSDGGAIDITLEVYILTTTMRADGVEPMKVSRGEFKELYWTIAQMLTHHTSNGCNLRPGDLIASGTVSGNTKTSRGCLLEYTMRGSEPLELPGGETRRFLQDGDEIIIRGFCDRQGTKRIGFGECRGRVGG